MAPGPNFGRRIVSERSGGQSFRPDDRKCRFDIHCGGQRTPVAGTRPGPAIAKAINYSLREEWLLGRFFLLNDARENK